MLAIFCNILVCLGVIAASMTTDMSGKIMAIFVPVSFFVIAGFEHCVANMFYVPAGLLCMSNPVYAQLAELTGQLPSQLSWSAFLLHNLIPVTLGNIAGGVLLSLWLYACNRKK